MYANILKKDLKRKKTMNIILLIFVILSVTFVSSSVANLFAVTNALDSFFEMANISDYVVCTKGIVKEGENIDDIAKRLDYIDSCESEKIIFIPENTIDKDVKMSNTGIMTSVENSYLKYFDKNNEQIKTVGDDEIYLTNSSMNEIASEGEKIKITLNGKAKELTVKGGVKDALLGSPFMGSPRFLVNQKTFEFFNSAAESTPDSYLGNMFFINTSDTSAFGQELKDCQSIVFMGDRAMIKTTYIVDMVIAGVLLIVSICLIIIAFVILNFTIRFTLQEEYKEIGIMKAIGIKNRKIRGLYIVKYLAISLVGTVIGFVCSIPFGNLLIQQVSENIVIKQNIGYWLNVICSLMVVLIIMLFCYKCTSKVKKFSPVDAIRSGETGERYKKKGLLRLSKSHIKTIPFMSMNDILSGFKHFFIMFVTFTIGILLVLTIINTTNTLKSNELITSFSMVKSDLYVDDGDSLNVVFQTNGHQALKEKLNEIENTLKENGIEAKCFSETIFKFNIEKGDKSYNSLTFIGTNTTTDQYKYMEGTAPQNTNEIAITYIISDKINAKIGDTVSITTTQGTKDYIVTAIYQSMNNMGEGIRLHQDEKLDFSKAIGAFPYQIKYTDNPSSKTAAERVQLVKDLFPEYTVRNGSEYINNMLGGTADSLSGVKTIIVAIVMVINILVVVLMEKSFLIKERKETALLKALGFKNNSIILWQVLRIFFVMLSSIIAAMLLLNPFQQITTVQVFKIMGAYSVNFDVNILEVYVIYPLAILAVAVLAVFIIAQQIRKVQSSEINNMD